MVRLRRRGRRRKGLKLKKETVYFISALLLIGAAFFTALSFFQPEGYLFEINQKVVKIFGWTAYILPLVLLPLAFTLLSFRLFIGQSHFSAGLLIMAFSLLVLTRAGSLGQEIWSAFEPMITGLGEGVILAILFIVGLTILLNTSLDRIVIAAMESLKKFLKFFRRHIYLPRPAKNKPVFVSQAMPPESRFQRFQQGIKESSQGAKTEKPTGGSPPFSQPVFGAKMVVNPAGIKAEIWEYPPLSLLTDGPAGKADRGDMNRNAGIIEKTLDSFGVTARVVEVNLGPAVTQYALEIALGTKVSKITSLANDLALALSAPTGQIRIEAPIPGRNLVGIEVPNRALEFVTLKQMMQSDKMKNAKSRLAVALGLDVSGQPIIADVARMPHVLIAGTTGSGKSVLVNAWISSLLLRTTPNEIRLILIDPKRVELTGYNSIPHLLTPVIVEVDKTLSALKWALSEMDRRYKQFAEAGARNIEGFNETAGFQALPYIIIFIDELADLMAYAPVEVEDSITRLAQMARATGIHLIVSTQRPSVDVITGLIKANIPARIAFNVSSMVDSRVIIDMPGAEKLLGRGDMLYIPPDQAKPTRIQGTFVSEKEVVRIVDFFKSRNLAARHTAEITSIPVAIGKKGTAAAGVDGRDQLFEDAVRIVCQFDRASASLLQRKLSVGYARAARILDQLEDAGIVGAGEGAKPRDVLVRNADEYFTNQPTQP